MNAVSVISVSQGNLGESFNMLLWHAWAPDANRFSMDTGQSYGHSPFLTRAANPWLILLGVWDIIILWIAPGGTKKNIQGIYLEG